MAEPAVKPSVEMVEIEGGQIATAEIESISSRGLPYEIVVEKLHFGTDRHNYHITEDTLGTGGQKSKFQNNIAAIQILKQIEAENRLATSEEQETLAKYVGWGGLAQAFDAANEKWATEYAKLKELLTPEEYEAARRTVLMPITPAQLLLRRCMKQSTQWSLHLEIFWNLVAVLVTFLGLCQKNIDNPIFMV